MILIPYGINFHAVVILWMCETIVKIIAPKKGYFADEFFRSCFNKLWLIRSNKHCQFLFELRYICEVQWCALYSSKYTFIVEKKIHARYISDRAKFYGFGTKSVTLRIYYVDLHDYSWDFNMWSKIQKLIAAVWLRCEKPQFKLVIKNLILHSDMRGGNIIMCWI